MICSKCSIHKHINQVKLIHNHKFHKNHQKKSEITEFSFFYYYYLMYLNIIIEKKKKIKNFNYIYNLCYYLVKKKLNNEKNKNLIKFIFNNALSLIL